MKGIMCKEVALHCALVVIVFYSSASVGSPMEKPNQFLARSVENTKSSSIFQIARKRVHRNRRATGPLTGQKPVRIIHTGRGFSSTRGDAFGGSLSRDQSRSIAEGLQRDLASMVKSDVIVREILPDGRVGDVINNIGDQLNNIRSKLSRDRNTRMRQKSAFDNNQMKIDPELPFHGRVDSHSRVFGFTNRDTFDGLNQRRDILRQNNDNRRNGFLSSHVSHFGSVNRRDPMNNGDFIFRPRQTSNMNSNLNVNTGTVSVVGGTRFRVLNDRKSVFDFNSNGRLSLGGIPSGIIGGTGFPDSGYVINERFGMGNDHFRPDTNARINQRPGSNRRPPINKNVRVNRIRPKKPVTKVHIIRPSQAIINAEGEIMLGDVIGIASKTPASGGRQFTSGETFISPVHPFQYMDPIIPFLLDGDAEMLAEMYQRENMRTVVVREPKPKKKPKRRLVSRSAPISATSATGTKTLYVQSGSVIQLSPSDLNKHSVITIVGGKASGGPSTGKRKGKSRVEEAEVEAEERKKTTTTQKPTKKTGKKSASQSTRSPI